MPPEVHHSAERDRDRPNEAVDWVLLEMVVRVREMPILMYVSLNIESCSSHLGRCLGNRQHYTYLFSTLDFSSFQVYYSTHLPSLRIAWLPL